MRVVFLTQWFDPEPGAIRGLPLARELIRRDVDVEVVTGVPNYPGGKVYAGYKVQAWQREVMDGVPVLRVGLYPSHDSNPLGRVANYGSFALSSAVLGPLLTKRGDVGFVYHPPPTIGVPAFAFAKLHRTPFVYHIADMWPESVVESGMLGHGLARDVGGAVLGAYCKWVYRHAAALTVLSPGFKRLLIERGVPAEKIHIVYNWADDDIFHPMPRDENLANELGFTGKLNFVYAGNLGAFQALETLIAAAAKVKHVPNIQVVLIGTGVREPELKRFAAETGATNVRFIGRRDMKEMPQINQLSDVLITHLKDLPFFRATVPSKTQVSLASGRPVLMGCAGDAADVIREAKAGIVVEPENVDQMAKAFLDFAAMSRDEREAMGAAGRAHYLETMSLRVGTERMHQIFTDVSRG